MEIVDGMREIFTGDNEFIKSTNYYFENHQCPKGGEMIKVMMDYKIREENSEKILKIGQCPKCRKVFYHEDFET